MVVANNLSILERDFDALSPSEQLQWLAELALIRKKQLLQTPLPGDNDGSHDAHRVRLMLLAAADSSINQLIKVNEVQLRQRTEELLPALLEKIEKALKPQ